MCQDPDLNWRHEDFQSTALPTELSRLFIYAHKKVYTIYDILTSIKRNEFFKK